jgi:hypothetical protein
LVSLVSLPSSRRKDSSLVLPNGFLVAAARIDNVLELCDDAYLGVKILRRLIVALSVALRTQVVGLHFSYRTKMEAI